ncbi:MAG: DUF1127 domain-containing protein [Burkholderiaceae bacterium]
MRFTTVLQHPAGQRSLSYTLRYSESFGRVARCTPVATPVQLPPGGGSANDADISARGELEAIALRAQAANGFGDADAALIALPMGRPLDFASGDSPLLYRTAGLRELVADCSKWVVGMTRRLVDAWCRYQLARATYRALRGLDERTLHDIGFHRSEIFSVAAEIGGAVEATRIHALSTSRGR